MQCIKLSLLGLTEQDQTILNIAIKLVEETQGITLQLLPENDVSGDFALVNADTEAGISYLKQGKSDQVKIILAKQFVAMPGSRFLERPVRIHDLVNAINTSCKRFKPKTVAENEIAVTAPTASPVTPATNTSPANRTAAPTSINTPPASATNRSATAASSTNNTNAMPASANAPSDNAPINASAVTTATRATPENATTTSASAPATSRVSNNTPLLLHEFITACKKNTMIKLECPPYSPFYVNGLSGSVATRASLPEIHIIAREKETRPTVTTLSAAEEFEHATDKSMTVYPIKTVIWHTALVGANGAMLPNHSQDTAVKLKSLPRFPREYMRKHPEYLKMSALLTRQAMTVKQLQQVTHLHLNVIIDFYNLVFSLGLSSIDQSANTSEQYERKRSANSSLLSRLAKKLNATG